MRKKRIGIGILLAISMFILFLVGWRFCLSQQNAVYRLTNQAMWHKETYWLPPSSKSKPFTACQKIGGTKRRPYGF